MTNAEQLSIVEEDLINGVTMLLGHIETTTWICPRKKTIRNYRIARRRLRIALTRLGIDWRNDELS